MLYKTLFFLLLIGTFLSSTVQAQHLHGRGATFPEALYRTMFQEYQNITGTIISYDAVGSGSGIRATLAQEIDFGASDRFLSDEQLASATPSVTGEPNRILHFPIAESAVVIIYNFLPFSHVPHLVLDGETLGAIFLGNIRNWNHPKIKELNPDTNLPNIPITVVYRSEASGTTSIFTDYLSKTSSDWAQQIGQGGHAFLDWNVGIGASGSDGMVEAVRLTPGAIGYVVQAKALNQGVQVSSLINRSGNLVSASLESVTNAANVPLPSDFRISLTDTSHPRGWPIVGFTYLLVYQDQSYIQTEEDGTQKQRSLDEARQLVGLLRWMLTEGQKFNEPLNYAPISENVRDQALELANTIFYGH